MRTTNCIIWPAAFAFVLAPALLACSQGVTTGSGAGDAGAPIPQGPPPILSDGGTGMSPVDAFDGAALAVDAPGDATTTVDAVADAPPPPVAADASIDSAPPAISIDGTVTDTQGNPAAGRTINVLDGAKATHVAVTDSTGQFTMTGVVTPYTLTVAGPAGATLGQLCYVGVSTPEPSVVAYTPAPAASPAASSLPFTANIAVPNCGTASCVVSIDAASPGGPSYSMSSTAAAGAVFPMSDTLPLSGPAATQATFNVLVSDSVFSQYWFSQQTVSLAAGGPPIALGTLTPTSIPSAATLTVTSNPVGPVSSWPAPFESVSLSYGGGVGAVQLGFALSDTLSMAIPDILGATLTVQSLGKGLSDGGIGIPSSLAIASGLPLTTTQAPLTLSPPDTWTLPSTPGQAVPSTSTLSWQPSVSTAFSVIVLVDDLGNFAYVFTPGTSLSLDLLAKTGIVPAAGSYVLEVGEITPSSSLDAVLEAGGIVPLLGLQGPGASWEGVSTIGITLTP